MYPDPVRSYNDLCEIHKVYEAFAFILNAYTLGVKTKTLKDVLLEIFKGDSIKGINHTIHVALNEYDPFLYTVYNAIIDFEKSNNDCFDCQKHRDFLARVMEQSKKAMDETRLEEIYKSKEVPPSYIPETPEYFQNLIEKKLLYPDGKRVLGSLDALIDALGPQPAQFIQETFLKANGKPYTLKHIQDVMAGRKLAD